MLTNIKCYNIEFTGFASHTGYFEKVKIQDKLLEMLKNSGNPIIDYLIHSYDIMELIEDKGWLITFFKPVKSYDDNSEDDDSDDSNDGNKLISEFYLNSVQVQNCRFRFGENIILPNFNSCLRIHEYLAKNLVLNSFRKAKLTHIDKKYLRKTVLEKIQEFLKDNNIKTNIPEK